ncbi:MAG: hypothetical protein V7754_21330 [Halioglobus sp.]
MKKHIIISIVAIAILAKMSSSFAEDVDLFLGHPGGSPQPPNILFIVDNTANWNTPFSDEMQALQDVFLNLPEGEVNVGLMMFTETGGGNSNVDGGYIRAAIRPMTAANKALYASMISELDQTDDKSNGGKAGTTLAEAYSYFAGLDARSGINKVKTDYFNNQDGVRTIGNGRNAITVSSDQDIYNLTDNALSAVGGPTYNPPGGLTCTKNYIIWVGNGAAQDNSSDSTTASQMLAALNGDTAQISLSPSGSADNMGDEWARFMRHDSPEKVTMFTLDINKVTNGQGPGWTALLKSMATQSEGKYYDVDGNTADITAALDDALSSILAVNSVFSSVALPASANTQSTFLNQVYIGLFRPNDNTDPRWHGNLKQYKLGIIVEDGERKLKVMDADSAPIVDSGTGFINECARSFWTPNTTDSYWDFLNSPRGTCVGVANSAESNSPDGPIVEKGGQAYLTRAANPANRNLKTCSTALASCTIMTTFDSTNVSQGDLLASSTTERDELIAWAKGMDVDDEDGDFITTESRPSLHGDVIHTQPVAIDYASDPNDPDVVVFYGGNDGVLRAVNGNRSVAHNTVDAGHEFWAFMPPESYDIIKRLRDNTPGIKFPATATTAPLTGQLKDYGADGPITTYKGDILGTDKVYLYAGLRRGGRSLTAFDVTSINSPGILWKRGCPNLNNNTGCTAGWENIGQTWSKAAVTQAENYANPLLLMGGGYDDCEDFDDNGTGNHNCTASSTGNSVYLIDATTGAILKEFTHTAEDSAILPRAFTGDITVVSVSDGNQDIKYAYAADTGGNLYRISGGTGSAPAAIETTLPADWIITRVASLGCGPDATTTCAKPRKFLYGPDVIRGLGPNKFTLLIGSGDREKPLYDYGSSGSIDNYFFAVVDEPANPFWTDDQMTTDPVPVPVCDADLICLNSLTTVTTAGGVNPDAQGWKMAMTAGEQVVSGALVVADIVNFSTHIPVLPNPASCESNLGEANIYNVDFEDGEGVKNYIKTGGLVPTPVAGKVVLDDGEIVPFCIGCGGEGSAIGSKLVTGGGLWTQPTSRVSWEVEK